MFGDKLIKLSLHNYLKTSNHNWLFNSYQECDCPNGVADWKLNCVEELCLSCDDGFELSTEGDCRAATDLSYADGTPFDSNHRSDDFDLLQEFNIIFNTEDWTNTNIECQCQNGTPLEDQQGCGGSQLCGSCDEGYELYNNLCLPTEEVESLSSSCLTEIKDTDYFFMMENSVSVPDLDFQTSVDAAERFFRGISFSENSDNTLTISQFAEEFHTHGNFMQDKQEILNSFRELRAKKRSDPQKALLGQALDELAKMMTFEYENLIHCENTREKIVVIFSDGTNKEETTKLQESVANLKSLRNLKIYLVDVRSQVNYRDSARTPFTSEPRDDFTIIFTDFKQLKEDLLPELASEMCLNLEDELPLQDKTNETNQSSDSGKPNTSDYDDDLGASSEALPQDSVTSELTADDTTSQSNALDKNTKQFTPRGFSDIQQL